MPALVADLRRAAADTGRPAAVRQAAAAQIARLAAAGARGAGPGEWYALTELSDAGTIVAEGQAVRLSPSQVEAFTKCGLRWLLEAAVGQAGRMCCAIWEPSSTPRPCWRPPGRHSKT